MTDGYPFSCCGHCMCAGPDREGHDDPCRFGCNDDASAYHARVDADNARIRAELHDRLNQLDDTQLDALAHELAGTAPDAVNDALNEIGAP